MDFARSIGERGPAERPASRVRTLCPADESVTGFLGDLDPAAWPLRPACELRRLSRAHPPFGDHGQALDRRAPPAKYTSTPSGAPGSSMTSPSDSTLGAPARAERC